MLTANLSGALLFGAADHAVARVSANPARVSAVSTASWPISWTITSTKGIMRMRSQIDSFIVGDNQMRSDDANSNDNANSNENGSHPNGDGANSNDNANANENGSHQSNTNARPSRNSGT